MTRVGRVRVLGAPLGDVVLAAVLAVFAFADTVFTEQFSWLDQWRGLRTVNGIVVPLAALLLAWRRRYPLAVLVGAFAAIDTLGVRYGSTQASTSVFILAIAIYTAVAYGSSVPAGIGVSVVGIWLRDAYDPLLRTFGDRLWDWVFAAIFVGIGYATRIRRGRLLAVESRARDAEREHAARVEAAAEEERRRIARELHDIVAHSLGLLVFQAGVGEQLIDNDPAAARDAFRSIRVAGLEAVGEMGTILGLIRGDRGAGREPQPRVADIETLVGKARGTGAAVEFAVHGTPPTLPAAVELSLYRIAQEGLTNAMRHAPSAPVRVEVQYRDDRVDVEVVNGKGSSVAGPGGGRGLIGLAERVAIFGGRIDVGPRPDGWRLAVSLPVAR
jgi:signal transduction histidine kinase